MSFWKAGQLLALATLVAARHAGVTLDDVIERFSVSKRTAQRMMRALESQFTDTNVSTEVALAFKLGVGKRLQTLGARIEALYPGLKAGEGAALLMNCYALIIGLWQQAEPPLSLKAVMDRPEMRIFKIDFEKQLNAALLDLWEAAARRVR